MRVSGSVPQRESFAAFDLARRSRTKGSAAVSDQPLLLSRDRSHCGASALSRRSALVRSRGRMMGCPRHVEDMVIRDGSIDDRLVRPKSALARKADAHKRA